MGTKLKDKDVNKGRTKRLQSTLLLDPDMQHKLLDVFRFVNFLDVDVIIYLQDITGTIQLICNQELF